MGAGLHHEHNYPIPVAFLLHLFISDCLLATPAVLTIKHLFYGTVLTTCFLFLANFNNPSENSEVLWRVRTLRGQIKLTGATWAEAMSRCIDRAAASLKT